MQHRRACAHLRRSNILLPPGKPTTTIKQRQAFAGQSAKQELLVRQKLADTIDKNRNTVRTSFVRNGNQLGKVKRVNLSQTMAEAGILLASEDVDRLVDMVQKGHESVLNEISFADLSTVLDDMYGAQHITSNGDEDSAAASAHFYRAAKGDLGRGGSVERVARGHLHVRC